jgi:hypothetical protein
MADDLTILRYVSWRDICPWILLAKVFRAATSMSVLALAFAAVLLSTMAWNFSRTCCLSEATLDDVAFANVRAPFEAWPSDRVTFGLDSLPSALRTSIPKVLDEMSPVTTSFVSLTEPFVRLFDRNHGWDRWCYLLIGGLLNVVIWSFFGLAIARISTARLGRGETIGVIESLDFAIRKWLSCIASPLMPLAAIFVLALPLMLAGLLMRIDLGAAVVGVLWLLVAMIGLLMAGLSIGLFFGWPLMWCTIATESSDAFDAVSRSYSYTFQRPLQYLFYSILAIVLGVLGWVIVWLFSEAVIQLSGWAVSIGTGEDRWYQLGQAMQGTAANIPSIRSFSVWMIGMVNATVRTVVIAFNYSFFWSAAVAIYLLLRMDTDQTELDDIYFDDEDNAASPLPQFETDAAGGPSSKEKTD